MRKFLTARWEDLIMANYEVDPSLLASRVPPGTELDFHEGKCFVSLVGFMFLDTRVMNFLIPFHVNFEEVNLRFYVRRETEDEVRRGVVFIKEIVPRLAIAQVARSLYGEPYECWKMSNDRDDTSVGYSWEKSGCANTLKINRGRTQGVPADDSHGSFIIEHYWGYTKRGENRTDEYKVEHPKWELFEAEDVQIDVDFGATYGEEFEFLKKAQRSQYTKENTSMADLMTAQDYPIHHFGFMQSLAERLKELRIQILSHEYHYQSFGSWWFDFMHVGKRFRVVFDGRDSNLRLDENLGDWMAVKWEEVANKGVTTRDIEELISEVLWLMNAAIHEA
jgi:uncharacterized protein YqjF (DUF2071 family)